MGGTGAATLRSKADADLSIACLDAALSLYSMSGSLKQASLKKRKAMST